MAHWVEREARRANRNLFITNLAFVIGTILVVAETGILTTGQATS